MDDDSVSSPSSRRNSRRVTSAFTSAMILSRLAMLYFSRRLLSTAEAICWEMTWEVGMDMALWV